MGKLLVVLLMGPEAAGQPVFGKEGEVYKKTIERLPSVKGTKNQRKGPLYLGSTRNYLYFDPRVFEDCAVQGC